MKSSVLAAAPLALALTFAGNGFASPPDTENHAVRVVNATNKPSLESAPVKGSGIERIRATIAIDAPIDRVRTVLFDYDKYPEFMTMYSKAGVLWTTPAGDRLVHMEIGGVVHLWMRVQIAPVQVANGVEHYTGKLVQGNVKDFRPRWELESLTPDRTRVTVESFLDPDLPLVPDGLINSGARDGMKDAIVALKARVEGRPVK